MKNLKRFVLIGILIFSVVLVSFFSVKGTEDYTIVGNSVVYDNDRLFFNITPHTLTSSSCVDFNLISKTYSGQIDAGLGFNTNIIKPRSAYLYNPRWFNITNSYTCKTPYFNYTLDPKHAWCYTEKYNNITLQYEKREIYSHDFDYGNLPTKTIYWNESR